MKKALTGNMDLSWGVLRSRAQVIGVHPLMSQASLIGELAALCAAAKRDVHFVEESSEHSAIAACMGASATGARAFTAVSAQGLASMHELLHRAALGRLPMVLAVAPWWSQRTDGDDPLVLRDTGWLQFYCRSGQEVLDTVIQAFKISEQVLLPSMLILDHLVSSAAKYLDIPNQKEVDRYLPSYRPKTRLDVNAPRSFGFAVASEDYGELRRQMKLAMNEALRASRKADQDYRRLFGRGYGLVGQYRCRGAETILMTCPSIAETARKVVDQLRTRGEKVGMVAIRLFRPFPTRLIRSALKGAKRAAVIDTSISLGSGGILHQEIKAALYNLKPRPKAPLFGFIVGLSGLGVAPETILRAFHHAEKGHQPEGEIIWMEAQE
jgi:pyruvate/2-oxoacid:ferredoxin oxidoreductase alpha subunit